MGGGLFVEFVCVCVCVCVCGHTLVMKSNRGEEGEEREETCISIHE